MTRKCLIALAILSLFAGSVAQADPAWGVTTAMVYEWAKKTCEPIKVMMKVVRWADIYGCKRPIILIQQQEGNDGWDPGDFVGCKWLKVCNNFENLRVDAELVDLGLINVKHWYVSLVYDSSWEKTTIKGKNYPSQPVPEWNKVRGGMWGPLDEKSGPDKDGAATTELIPDVHLTGSLGWLSLCVRAKGVDPQSAEFKPYGTENDPKPNLKHAANVVLTFYPNDPPGDADFYQGAVSSSGGIYPTDDLNDPDMMWDSMTGGGGGVPTGPHNK